MDRRSQIFAPTSNVGGVRKPAKKQTTVPTNPGNPLFKKTCEAMKNDIRPTILKSFSYKQGEQVFTVNEAKIRSIGKNKKHVAFLISGDAVEVEKSQIAEAMGKSTEV